MSVLVVDDSLIIRALVGSHLQQRGFVVVQAADGREAAAALAVRRFDLLITDLEMPNMDGHELLELVHDQYPLMRRVVMTGYTTIENALDALKLGSVGFVPKPIELPVLDEVLDLAVAEMRCWMRQLAAIRRLRREDA
ncbi:MAG: response regulator [Planctomycetes bacterium]|nr:response regulator [Planctomycetota bacterium]